jgi:hypothetical protein
MYRWWRLLAGMFLASLGIIPACHAPRAVDKPGESSEMRSHVGGDPRGASVGNSPVASEKRSNQISLASPPTTSLWWTNVRKAVGHLIPRSRSAALPIGGAPIHDLSLPPEGPNSNFINVRTLATGGSGTAASPWLGWENIKWEGKSYFFPAGCYAYSKAPNFAKQGIRLYGEGAATVLIYRGVGPCVVFDGSAIGGVNDVCMDSFVIKGNAAATYGVFVDTVHRGILRHIRVTDVGMSGFKSKFSVFWHLEDFRVTYNEGSFSTKPHDGIVLGERGGSASAYVIDSPVIEGVSSSGIKIVNGFSNTIKGGSSEENDGYGLEIAPDAYDNTIIGVDLEANPTLISGTHNTLIGITSGSSDALTFSSSASLNTVLSGTFGKIVISSGAAYNKFEDCRVIQQWADSGMDTAILDVYNLAAGAWLPSRIPTRLSIEPMQIIPAAGVGLTVDSKGHVNRQIYIATADYRLFAGGSTMTDKIIATLPNRTKIVGFYAVVNTPFTGGAIANATLQVGTTAGGGELLNIWSVFSEKSKRGFSEAEVGPALNRSAAVQGGYFPTWDGVPTPIYVRLATTGANTDAATAGSVTFYIVTEYYGY